MNRVEIYIREGPKLSTDPVVKYGPPGPYLQMQYEISGII